jgi:tetratricopeptide (TPR) repeat protein
LEVWVRYDEKYVYQNARNQECRFQRATAHRRLGQGRSALGDLADAESHLRQALALLDELAAEQPAVSSYRGEKADTYARLAWVLYASGNRSAADAACRQALQLMDDAPLPNDEIFNARCAYAYSSLGNLAERQGQHDQALALLGRSAALFRQMMHEATEFSDFQTQFARIQGKLESAGSATAQ